VCWHLKTRLESGPVTADLTTTVVHSYQLLINDVKPVHSLMPGLLARPSGRTFAPISIPGWVRSKTEKLTPVVASMINVYIFKR